MSKDEVNDSQEEGSEAREDSYINEDDDNSEGMDCKKRELSKDHIANLSQEGEIEGQSMDLDVVISSFEDKGFHLMEEELSKLSKTLVPKKTSHDGE